MEKNSLFFAVLTLVLILLAALFSPVLGPPLLALAFFYYFYPYLSSHVCVKRGYAVASLFLTLWLWNELKGILIPFVTALFLAYLLDPVADILEKKMNRSLAVLIIMIFIIALSTLTVLVIVPKVVAQMTQLIQMIGKNQAEIFAFVEKHWKVLEKTDFFDTQALLNSIKEFMNNLTKQLSLLFTGFSSLFQQLFNIFIIPVVTFYILRDFDKIKDWIFSRFETKERKKAEKGYFHFNRIFGRYVRGVLLDSLIVGTATFLGLLIAGVPYALFIGIMTFIFNLIPYVGIWIAFGLSVVIVLSSGFGLKTILIMAAIYFFIQVIESVFLYPRIVGKMVGLYPVAVMIMLLILSRFLGIFGLFLGVPISALFWFFIDRKLMAHKEVYGKKV